jgi:hypothetical protein
VPEYDDDESLAGAVRAGRVSWVLARRRDLDAAAVTAEFVAGEPVFAWEQPKQVGNKLVLVRVGAEAEARAKTQRRKDD